ncbi:MAG: hypothetical protein K8R60_13420 [Burkholderiales bacterium]|nr:hypothetical protein [Burkholderiales bacterium]
MQRRHLLALSAAGLLPTLARAHHGWGGFDQDKPLYLEGKAESVVWRNPHAELKLRLAPGLALPADLAKRSVPAQSASVDAPRVLAAARLPTRKDAVWELELAPLTRMEAWKVAEIKPGQAVAAIGYTFPAEKGEAVMRVEYLFVDGKAYGLRSSPT